MNLSDSRGRAVTVGGILGRGGEAGVYSVSADTRVVAKVYHSPSAERAAKLQVMVADPPSDPTAAQNHVSICWPTELLFDRQVNVGFLMHRVDFASNVPVFTLYNPRDRQQVALDFTWQYLLRAATNIASVVEAIHSRGYIVGDLNESNILVANTAMVTVVDCDSMQVPKPGAATFFRCPVGKPEYTAPELQGLDFSRVDRTQAHDNFSLGVLLFQLLMEGAHPFGGVWHGAGDPPPLEERIRIGASPYAGAASVSPAPGAPPFDILGSELRTLIRRCFKDGHGSPPARPSPREWRQALVAAEAGLVTCAKSNRHVHVAHLARCPWCARTQLLGGLDPFPLAGATRPTRQARPPVAPPGIQPLPAIATQAAPAVAQPPIRPLRPSPTSASALPATIAGAIVIVGLAALAGFGSIFDLFQWPPDEYADLGACPYEGCQYGERWLALNDVPIFSEQPERLGQFRTVEPSGSVPKGQWVTTQTGIYIAPRSEAHVDFAVMRPSYGYRDTGPPLQNGQAFSVYGGLGEGCSRVWMDGTFPVVCGLVSASNEQAPSEWWVQVKLANGSIGWTDTGGDWISQGGLNHRIAQTIADENLTISEKQRRLRTDIALGGELNGDVTVYSGDTAHDAAIRTASVPLLRTLQAMGMRFNRPCSADGAVWDAMKPEREAPLQFLIDNGLDLTCINRSYGSPAIHMFLLQGIESENYSATDAIRLARFLARNGVDVSATDGENRRVLDVVRQKNRRGRFSDLIVALSELSPPDPNIVFASPDAPDATVLTAFEAFVNGAQSIDPLMSGTGLSNARIFCSDGAIGCLTSNYRDAGSLSTYAVTITSQDNNSARIELRSTWVATDVPDVRCQNYRLSLTTVGWQIDFFDGPSRC